MRQLWGSLARATSPAIGSGMNTALADAAVLNDLLDEFADGWDEVLPAKRPQGAPARQEKHVFGLL